MRVRWVDGEDSAFDSNSHPFKGPEIPPMSNLVSQGAWQQYTEPEAHTQPSQESRELIRCNNIILNFKCSRLIIDFNYIFN